MGDLLAEVIRLFTKRWEVKPTKKENKMATAIIGEFSLPGKAISAALRAISEPYSHEYGSLVAKGYSRQTARDLAVRKVRGEKIHEETPKEYLLKEGLLIVAHSVTVERLDGANADTIAEWGGWCADARYIERAEGWGELVVLVRKYGILIHFMKSRWEEHEVRDIKCRFNKEPTEKEKQGALSAARSTQVYKTWKEEGREDPYWDLAAGVDGW